MNVMLPPDDNSDFFDTDGDFEKEELSTEELIEKGFEKHLSDEDEEAVKYFNRALKDPDCHLKAFAGKADALKWLGRYEEAVKVYYKCFEKGHTNERLYVNCGLCLNELERVDDEVWCYYKSLECNREYFWANWNLSIHYLNSGNDEKAFEFTRKCCELDPDHDNSHFNLACYLAKFEYKNEALDKLGEVIEKFGDKWKKKAIDDDYFDSVRKSKRFIELTGSD